MQSRNKMLNLTDPMIFYQKEHFFSLLCVMLYVLTIFQNGMLKKITFLLFNIRKHSLRNIEISLRISKE